VLEVGAHMRERLRTRSGSLADGDIHSLYDILKLSPARPDEREGMFRQIVRPMEDAFDYVPRIYIRDSAVSSICHGADLAVPGIVKLSEGIRRKTAIALFTLKGELVALSRALIGTAQMMKAQRGLAAKTVRVIMPADTYPKLWQAKHHRSVVTQFN